ncbi:hypothetical protein A9Q84_07290 [Halobacteriovorax marinus]|uniref:Uncharacterized protein n=1 Tax=Halobacteriovorax marinus TaxID=97084 RepID=A0A1Y5F5K0_9BACT|nr:hypothetical protein A9Q84_07290 [Halobacteriovorax marinus]
MAYSDLKKLKKEVNIEISKESVKYLVVGGDVFALSILDFLLKSKDCDNVKILTKELLTKESIEFAGPGILRGKENINYMKETFDYAGIEELEGVSLFYKDLKFKPFGGRSKSEKLLPGEEFFTSPRARFDSSSIFTFLNDEEYLNKVNSLKFDFIPSKVFKEEDSWVVECTNGTQISCEKIFWAESPWKFYELFSAKETLSNKFVEFVESTKTPCALHLKLEFDKRVTEKEETLLVPLSYTHDWGHFICEFDKNEDENKSQIGRFLTFIDVDETNEEDISKKIRLLKRNLEKIFPHIKGINTKEFIVLTDNTHSLKFDDSFAMESSECLKDVHFINSNAPFHYQESTNESGGDSDVALTHVSRGLKVLSQIKSILS